jgi:hypothetical protein
MNIINGTQAHVVNTRITHNNERIIIERGYIIRAPIIPTNKNLKTKH